MYQTDVEDFTPSPQNMCTGQSPGEIASLLAWTSELVRSPRGVDPPIHGGSLLIDREDWRRNSTEIDRSSYKPTYTVRSIHRLAWSNKPLRTKLHYCTSICCGEFVGQQVVGSYNLPSCSTSWNVNLALRICSRLSIN